MATNKTFSALDASTELVGDEIIPIIQNGQPARATPEKIRRYAGIDVLSGGSVVQGKIWQLNFNASNFLITENSDGSIDIQIKSTTSGGSTIIFQTNVTDFKDSVDLATTVSVSHSGEQTIDGVLTSASRILDKDNSDATLRGIWVTAAGAWSRATDADANDEVTGGMLVLCTGGATNVEKLFVLTNTGPINLGTTALVFDSIVLPSNPEIVKAVNAAAYTLLLTDPNKWLQYTKNSAGTFTVPNNSTTKIPVNSVIYAQLYDASGSIAFSAAAGVTIDAPQGLNVTTLYAVARLKKTATNKWSLTITGQPATAGKQTIFMPAGAMTARTTNGPSSGSSETSSNKVMLVSLDFDTSTQEFAQFQVRMPKGWNESTVTAAFVWSHAATVTNFGVVWALQGIALSDGDAGDTAFGTAQQIADTGGTTDTIYITAATPAITIGGTPAAEDWVVFQVKRVPSDGSDTLAVDARLHGLTLYYTTDADTDA